jgi:UDP-GlcNAc3NAcA epimerase
LHRAENTDDPQRLKSLFDGLNTIADTCSIVLPLHPRTKNIIAQQSIVLSSNIKVLDPLSYTDFMRYMKHCTLLISDSGGIQKEAYFMHKNCLVLREETEWTELIKSRNNTLVGTDKAAIIAAFEQRNEMNQDFSTPIYGTGKTAEEIIQCLLNF